MKPIRRPGRRKLLAGLLAGLIGAGLASTLIAGMARADTTQNPPPCIPAGGYPNTPDTRKLANLSAQEMADLRKDILEAIIMKETRGVATESKMKTSSGYQASYKSLVQTTEPTAITTLQRLPADQLAGFKPTVGDGKPLTRAELRSAQTVSDAAVFLWKGMRAAEWANEKARDDAAKAGTALPARITADDVLRGTFKGHNNEASRAASGLTKDDVTTMLTFYRTNHPPLEDGFSWARRAISTGAGTSATAAKIQDIVTRPDADGRAGLALGRTVVTNAIDDVLKTSNPKTMSVDDFVAKVGVKHNGSGKAAVAYGKDLVKIYHQKMQERLNHATKPCPKPKKSTAPRKPKAPRPNPQPATPPAAVSPAPASPSPSLSNGAGTLCIPLVERCPGHSDSPSSAASSPPVQLPDLPNPPAPVIPVPAGPPGGQFPDLPSQPDAPDPGPPPADGGGTLCIPEIESCPRYSEDPQLVDPGSDPGSDGGYYGGGGGYYGGGGGGGDYPEDYLDEPMRVA